MGVFIEGAKNTAAAEAALKINYFFSQILEPEFREFYYIPQPHTRANCWS